MNSVNSREVHEYLKVGKDYSNWIKDAIDKYGFEEGNDYLFAKIGENPGRPRKDYIVTLDMAKELCMVSNTPKGKETRKWFIAQEKLPVYKHQPWLIGERSRPLVKNREQKRS